MTPKELVFRPAPIVVVEGIFVFHFEEIAKLLDLKVYIDAQEHVKLHRRIIRDRDERGYDLADVLYRYTHHVAPTYERFIAPYKHDADIVIPNNRHFEQGPGGAGGLPENQGELLNKTYLQNQQISGDRLSRSCSTAALLRHYSLGVISEYPLKTDYLEPVISCRPITAPFIQCYSGSPAR